MAHSIRFTTDQIVRRDYADHAPANKMRDYYRTSNNDQRRKDGNDPFNEAFSFTPDEYALLKKIRPHLFEGSPQDRKKAWVAFANSTEGRMFRVR